MSSFVEEGIHYGKGTVAKIMQSKQKKTNQVKEAEPKQIEGQ